jgi:hypothetical protein
MLVKHSNMNQEGSPKLPQTFEAVILDWLDAAEPTVERAGLITGLRRGRV